MSALSCYTKQVEFTVQVEFTLQVELAAVAGRKISRDHSYTGKGSNSLTVPRDCEPHNYMLLNPYKIHPQIKFPLSGSHAHDHSDVT